MRDQLVAGLGLGAVAAGTAVAGLTWLAIAASVAAVPFLVAGIGFAVGGHRDARERPAGPAR
ncbi:MAG: hypothetical protein R6W48_01965 [Gaiellaceae bacterium]